MTKPHRPAPPPLDGLEGDLAWTTSPRRRHCLAGDAAGVHHGAPTVATTTSTRLRTALHRSPPLTVPLYDEASELVTATVRAAFWDNGTSLDRHRPGRAGTPPRRDHLRRWRRAAVLHSWPGAWLRRWPRACRRRRRDRSLLPRAGVARCRLAGRARQCAAAVGLMPRRWSAWMGMLVPDRRAPP